ncbi:hypothetical protein U1Q18_035674 [Sarracenia purpurea var. burkii]
MIVGYASCNHHAIAWAVFHKMMREGKELPNAFTLSSALNACKGLKSLSSCGLVTLVHELAIKHDMRRGCLDPHDRRLRVLQPHTIAWAVFREMMREVHGLAIKHDVVDCVYVDNAFLELYTTCCVRMEETTLITGYTHRGDGHSGIQAFRQMLSMECKGFSPNYFTLSSFVAACVNLAVLSCGQQVHGTIFRTGFDENLALANALMDMYANHAGLVDEGLIYFKSMIGDYKIAPNLEIFGCVVDLLGRSGRVKEAYELIEGMPFKPDESIWGAFLGACKAHRVPDMGKLAARKIMDLGPKMAGTCVTISNIYAADGKWGEFGKMRKLMRGMGNKKEARRNWVEVRNQVCGFVVGDKVGAHIEWVYRVTDVLVLHMKDAGYVPDLVCSAHDLEDWA